MKSSPKLCRTTSSYRLGNWGKSKLALPPPTEVSLQLTKTWPASRGNILHSGENHGRGQPLATSISSRTISLAWTRARRNRIIQRILARTQVYGHHISFPTGPREGACRCSRREPGRTAAPIRAGLVQREHPDRAALRHVRELPL